jgi:hypothetical protein
MTRADHVLVWLFHMLPDKWSPWLLPPLFAATWAIFNADRFTDAFDAIRWCALVSVGMFAAIVLLSTTVYTFRIWRLPPESPALRRAVITLDDGGLTFAGAGSTTTLDWATITEVEETRRFVGVRHLGRAGQLYLIPKRCVPEDALAEMRRLFHASRARAEPRRG